LVESDLSEVDQLVPESGTAGSGTAASGSAAESSPAVAAPTDASPAAVADPGRVDPSPVGLELIEQALDEFVAESGVTAHLEDRTIRLLDPVPGSPHLAVLRVLGFATKAGPVGAAAHGPQGVAAAVWDSPTMYMVRWTGGSRWVSWFKFPARGRPDDYLREASGIPSALTKGNWYDEVPDEITEAFLVVGVLLDEPPFPVPQPPAPPPEPASSSPSPRAPRTSAAPRPRAPRRPAAPATPKKVVPVTRTCAACNLAKHPSQFVEGSDLCVDCR
jgi:hypothetical protein